MVSLDAPEQNAEFANSLDANFPLLSDPEGVVAQAYGVSDSEGQYAKRWTFYIDETGVVRFIDKEINTETAGKDIADRLRSLDFPLQSASDESNIRGSD